MVHPPRGRWPQCFRHLAQQPGMRWGARDAWVHSRRKQTRGERRAHTLCFGNRGIEYIRIAIGKRASKGILSCHLQIENP